MPDCIGLVLSRVLAVRKSLYQCSFHRRLRCPLFRVDGCRKGGVLGDHQVFFGMDVDALAEHPAGCVSAVVL